MKKLSIRAFILFVFLFLPIFVQAEVRSVTVHGTIHEGNIEKQILDSVNEQRRLAGVPEIQMDLTLTKAARQRAIEIGTYYDSRHLRTNLGAASTVMNDFGISYYAFGENIAAGYSSVNTVMNEWIQSTPHYNNIVNSRYSAIGIGVYQSSDGKWFWVQDFKDSLNTLYEPTNTQSVVDEYNVRYEDTIHSSYTAEALNDVSLNVGDNHMINFHVTTTNDVTSSNVPLYLLDWESSNTNVAEIETINQKVYVSAKSAGTSTIKTTFGGVDYQFAVTVIGDEEPTVDNPMVWIREGENVVYSGYEVTGNGLIIEYPFKTVVTERNSDGSIKNPYSFDIFFCKDEKCDNKLYPTSFKSNNTNIADVIDNQFIFQNSGQATITAIFENGLRVSVPFNVSTFSFAKDQYSIFVGDSLDLEFQTNYDGEYSFKADLSNIVDVLENNTVKAKEAGTATITATSEDGFTATTKVTVYNKDPIVIDANTNHVELIEGEQSTLTVHTNNDNSIITYEILDKTIASCSEDGVISGLKEGTTKVLVHALVNITDELTLEAEKEIEVIVSKKEIPVTDIQIETTSYELYVSNVVDIIWKVLPENADNQTVSWKSSDNSIVSVDGNGKVSALAVGSAVVTVTANNGVSKDIQFSVISKQENSLQVDVRSIELTIGDTYTIQATSDQPITWSSDDNTIATVSDGVVTAIDKGSTILSVSDGTNTINITVVVNEKNIPITDLYVEQDSINLIEGEETTIMVSIYPNDTTDSLDLGWMSSNDSVVSVNQDGKITAIGEGEADITITSVNGVRCTVHVYVNKKSIPISNISVEEDNITLKEGESHSISVSTLPLNATEEVSFHYESSDTSVVTVSDDGILQAVNHGDAIITITTNTGLSTQVSVTVLQNIVPITDIETSRNSVTLTIGEETNITANVLPGYTTDDKTLIWSSSNESVVAVTQSGHLTAIASGKSIITVRASNGVSQTIEVIVSKKEETSQNVSPNKPASPSRQLVYNQPSVSEEKEDTTSNEEKEYDVVFDSNTFLLQSEKGNATLKIDELSDINDIIVLENEHVIAAYDIYFEDGGSTYVDSTYHIHIPISLDKNKYQKIYVASIVNGKVQEIFLSDYQDGVITFTTDRLGEYSIIGVNKEKKEIISKESQTSKEEPKESSSLSIILIILLIIFWIAAFFGLSRLTYYVFNKNKKE